MEQLTLNEVLPGNKRTCPYCNKTFSVIASKNRHIITIHQKTVEDSSVSHIFCPLCKEGEKKALKTNKNLMEHLEQQHKVCLNKSSFSFSSKNQYEDWMSSQNIEVNYSLHRTIKRSNFTEVFFVCNRSNLKGYKSNYKKRTEKSGGSIKINGVCPSQLTVKFYENGERVVEFQETHVGHKEEIRSQHLSRTEKEIIVEKLMQGVTTDRILEDARKLETGKLKRINLLSRKDVNYLATKHNVDKKRHKDEMTAAELKVAEWNANGKNYAFIFKKQGEIHEVLRKDDFALGFMNPTMEEKLKTFSNIICMDGTHGTNKRGMDLTIMLIKDDKNAGFPVAFFLTNRLDQQVQEVFLAALKAKLGEEIKPTYFMTDDDPKYYNAWMAAMGNEPRRLLCSWHVVKNWNIQGRAKIKNPDIKKRMKVEMKRIMNEMNEERFNHLTMEYFETLKKSNEIDFLNYLKKYYFQGKERIHMWAHCFRKNAGINTNMALESLNHLLKTNQLKRKTRITVEKLLDKIEDLVDIKMWQRILNIERPNANNYQDRIVIKAHKNAELMKNKIEVLERSEMFGQFQVKSFSGNHFYNVSYNEVCDSECRTLFCRVCKICVHWYQCECPEYAVKNTICKHVHLVCMHEGEKGTNSVLDDVVKRLGQEQESAIEQYHQEEISGFIEEKIIASQTTDTLTLRKIELDNVSNMLIGLDQEAYNRCLQKIYKVIEEEKIQPEESISVKRKMEKQEYYPTKKRHH